MATIYKILAGEVILEALQLRTHAVLYREQFEIEIGHQPQNALLIMQEGRFFCSFSEEESFIAEAGDLVFFPLKKHFTRKVLEPCLFHLIYFTLSDQNPIADYLPAGKIELSDRPRLEANVEIFNERPYETDNITEAIKQHALNDILMMYYHEWAPKQTVENRLSPPIRAVVQYCIDRIGEKITLQTMADVAKMSTSTLSRHFREETGFSPMEYLIRMRMRNAIKDLTKTSDPISEIAERCGYENIYYFSNAFKKVYGYSPSEHRRRNPRV